MLSENDFLIAVVVLLIELKSILLKWDLLGDTSVVVLLCKTLTGVLKFTFSIMLLYCSCLKYDGLYLKFGFN